MRLFLPFVVGLWSLCIQFVLNRIIYFYVANSEYSAATIISLHLMGFLFGSLYAKRLKKRNVHNFIFLNTVITSLAKLILWSLGVEFFGYTLNIIALVIFAFLFAFISGIITIQLINKSESVSGASDIIVLDSVGSALGALLGGFVVVPLFGISSSFMFIIVIQTAVCLTVIGKQINALSLAKRFFIFFLCLVSIVINRPNEQKKFGEKNIIMADGLPVASIKKSESLLFSQKTKFGFISVTGDREEKSLYLDNRRLCHVYKNLEMSKKKSNWLLGVAPIKSQKKIKKVAMIGLGCGLTLAAILSELPLDSQLDVIEINGKMKEAQEKFNDWLPFDSTDKRVNLIIDDGFNYFLNYGDNKYDAVILDVAWMHNMNASHLFSKEMYLSIKKSLREGGVLAVWSEEDTPLSKTSLVQYTTLKSVFDNVYTDFQDKFIIFFASSSRSTLLENQLSDLSKLITYWFRRASIGEDVNTLDNLILNKTKFNKWGDYKNQFLFKQYEEMFDNEKGPSANP